MRVRQAAPQDPAALWARQMVLARVRRRAEAGRAGNLLRELRRSPRVHVASPFVRACAFEEENTKEPRRREGFCGCFLAALFQRPGVPLTYRRRPFLRIDS